ncbi:MAG: aminoacyl-tRNA hydrolase [Rhizobiaceae bacterium]|nr:aminoacyl-tRNA hydrolase [Rhizobiaceae bacterium]
MLIIAGLGNPGGKYAGNRHNIGFMAADEIVRRHSFGPWKSKHKAEISDGTLDGEKVLIVKPMTFMNESGQSIGEILRFYKEDISNLVVIYDELDLAPGKLRIKTGGGHGGHNGIKSIDAHCGKDYRRMRLGIGHPGSKERVTGHVLGDFAKADQEWLDLLLRSIADNAALLADGKDANFMNKVALETGQNQDSKKKENKPAKQQSHIHQARKPSTNMEMPKTGPMADMLKKLFGDKG